MSTSGAPDRNLIKAGLVWLGRILALLVIALSLLVAVMRLLESAAYVGNLASGGTTFEIWGVLHGLALLSALIAIVGVGLALLRRKLLLALLFSLFAWPMAFVIEGSRCDTESACRMMGWAAIPASSRDWNIRIRSVTNRNEARAIASAALFRADSRYHSYNPKRFDDHWVVPTIDDDGRPGPSAVWIDTRTAATRFVSCPAHLMFCGMERPTLSDDGAVFSNARWGLAMSFPAGRAVCTARPDDDPLRDQTRGFYAMVRESEIPCDIVDPSRTLGLEALTARTVAAARPGSCKPLSPAVLKAFGGRAPGFVGHRSVVCEEIAQGQIAVSVFAIARLRAETGAPTTLYEAWMLTDPAHLAEDARSFEAFLKTAQIPAPAR